MQQQLHVCVLACCEAPECAARCVEGGRTFEDGVRIMLSDIRRWNDAPLWDPESISKATETWFRYMGKQRA